MSNWVLLLIVGILAMVVGGIAMVNPEVAGLSLSYLLSIGLIAVGALTIFFGFSAPSGSGVFWSILLGVLMIVTGVLLWKNPLAGVVTIEVIIAILMIASGVVMIMSAFTVDMGVNRWWAVIGGIASFVLAYFLFTDPGSLGFLLGLQLIFYGFALVGLALSARRMKSIYY